MQSIIIEKPYRFIPPRRGMLLPVLANKLRIIDWYLRRFEGVVAHELRGLENLQSSLDQKHGVLLAGNHCRYSDPIALGFIARAISAYPYQMASWHLFNQGRIQAWAMSALGGFSIYREGPDRQSLDTAIEILAEARRPLVIFPEGAVFRTNDRVNELLEGVALIARAAAKKRSKENPNHKVVVHPVALKYVPLAPIKPMIETILAKIEQRLTFEKESQRRLTQRQRILQLLQATLCLKEIEYSGMARHGCWADRQQLLIDDLLHPIELLYMDSSGSGAIIPRIKAIRSRVVPELLNSTTTTERKNELWEQLTRTYVAQQIATYPTDYLGEEATETRLLELAEQLYEDLYDKPHPVGPLKVVIQIDTAIEVAATRERGTGSLDLIDVLHRRIQDMLDGLSTMSPRIVDNDDY